jgi:hypothetical protein
MKNLNNASQSEINTSEIIQHPDLRTALIYAYSKNLPCIFVDGKIINLPKPQTCGTMTQRQSYINDKINTFLSYNSFFPNLKN